MDKKLEDMTVQELLLYIPEQIVVHGKSWEFYLTKGKGKSGKTIITAGYCRKNEQEQMEILIKSSTYIEGDANEQACILKDILIELCWLIFFTGGWNKWKKM